MTNKVVAPFTLVSASILQGGYLGAVLNENNAAIGKIGRAHV